MRIRKRRMIYKSKKVRVIIILFITVFLITSILAIIFKCLNNKSHNVIFKLNGEEHMVIEVNSSYIELGAGVFVDGTNKNNEIKIDTGNIDTSIIGEYKIKYYIIYKKREYKKYRTINVVDTTAPVISLNGNEAITILLNEEYTELGANAIDNYDGDISDKIVIEGKVDNKNTSEYQITYSIKDSSENISTISRKVIVKKPNKKVTISNVEEKEVKKEINENLYNNTITKNKFTSDGISIEGYIKNGNGSFYIKFDGEEKYSFPLTSINETKYTGNINFDGISNGKYDLFIESINEEKILNKMNYIDRIVRAKIGNKLVTLNYNSDDSITVFVENFNYMYHILIDPGHGGSDTGASNEYIYEKEMNLKISLYEKCRYESHGLSVYMTRDDDSYGNGMGSSSLTRLYKRAYEMGYIGAVSKIIYSNHHNAIGNNYYSGYEIILPGHLSNADMSSELAIMNLFNNTYSLSENHLRFYARNYDTDGIHSKLNGNTYSFKNYYAVIRIPYEIFNTKVIIYEGTYLTNKRDYDWYWNNKNWLKVSENKIQGYVESLGITYNTDNSACL